MEIEKVSPKIEKVSTYSKITFRHTKLIKTTKIVFCHYAELIGHKIYEGFLRCYVGYLHCDGCGAYPKLGNVQLIE